MYFNVILNGLQGLYLLIVYCIAGTEVRGALRKNLERSVFSSLLEKQVKTKSTDAMTMEPIITKSS